MLKLLGVESAGVWKQQKEQEEKGIKGWQVFDDTAHHEDASTSTYTCFLSTTQSRKTKDSLNQRINQSHLEMVAGR